MRTTLDIDGALLDEAMRVTGAPTKTAAVRLGLEALIDEAARRRLVALRGGLAEIVAPPRRRSVQKDTTR